MTVEEILNGESKEVEYKENVPANTKKFTKTAVAFANCAGGLLVFGVENNTWKVTGIPKDKVFEVADSISNAIVDTCEPLIDFDIKYQTIEEKTIIIVQVYPGKRRPYYLKVDGKTEGVYIRVPGSTRLADDFVIKELELEGANRSYDRMIAVGENVTEEEIEKACDTMYKYALSRCLTPEEKQNVKKVTKNQLLSWGLLQEQDGKMVPTNGYMLLNQNDLQEASVQCGVFKGTTIVKWTDSGVRGIIKNEKYKGDLLMGKTYTVDPISKRRLENRGEENQYYTKNHHEAIVSEEIWNAAQEICKNRYRSNSNVESGTRTKYARKFAFSSMCECGFCGTNLTRRSHHQDTQHKKPVWKCRVATNKGIENCPNSKAIDESIIENAFLEMFGLLADNFDDVLESVLSSVEETISNTHCMGRGDKRKILLLFL